MTPWTLFGVGLAILFALSSPGCSEKPTQIVISIDTNLIIPAQIDQVALRIDQQGINQPIFERAYVLIPFNSTSTSGLKLPATMALLAGDSSAIVEITVTGLLGSNKVVERRARLPFATGRILLLNMDLLAMCVIGRTSCLSTETCTAKGCESIAIDPGTLPNFNEAEALARMDAAVDTGVKIDAPKEAGLDSGVRDGGGDVQDGFPTDALRDSANNLDGPASDFMRTDGPLADGPRPDGIWDAAAATINAECVDSFPLGTVCGGGIKYTTKLGGALTNPLILSGGWIVMPGGCADQTNEPICVGIDTVKKTRAEAEVFCQALVLHGFSDWQLPEYHYQSTWSNAYEKDLEQIYDLRAQIPGLVISTDQSAHYWTQSEVMGRGQTRYWSARFWQPKPQDQGQSFYIETAATETHTFRCIRDYP